MRRATRDASVSRNNRNFRKGSSHPGQAKASRRKCANREEKARKLAQEALASGISVLELRRRRSTEVKDLRNYDLRAYKSHLGPEPEQRPQVHSIRVGFGFRDDDRRWKY